jgi:sodium-dependent dicarboxylate transporter 2/3/5
MNMRFGSTLVGVLFACGVYVAMQYGEFPTNQRWTAAVTVLCTTWWIFESLPLAATSLVPLAVFPLAGVLTERDVAAAYGDPLVLLFMGGFMIAQSAERCGAHRRVAHAIVATIGHTSGRRLVLAFMLATAFVSMWVSNTAAALMMLPIAIAVLEGDTSGKLSVPLLLGIAYSASIGGIATPIGSPPNGVFLAAYKTVTNQTVPFHEWMMVGGIVAALMLLATWLVLTRGLAGVPSVDVEDEGPWTVGQKRVILVFGLTALAWITREIPFGGWSQLLGASQAGDTSVALAAVVALFLIPSGEGDGERLLDWPTAAKIPWGVLILFGGGIAIARAFDTSGLSTTLGQLVSVLNHWPPLAILGTLCFAVTFLSEFTSNTATSNILMPILAAASSANDLNPAFLMFAGTLANSLAFMLPVGTPPNALVFGTGRVRMADMVRIGIVVNLIGVVIVTLVCWQMVPLVFGVGQ